MCQLHAAMVSVMVHQHILLLTTFYNLGVLHLGERY